MGEPIVFLVYEPGLHECLELGLRVAPGTAALAPRRRAQEGHPATGQAATDGLVVSRGRQRQARRLRGTDFKLLLSIGEEVLFFRGLGAAGGEQWREDKQQN